MELFQMIHLYLLRVEVACMVRDWITAVTQWALHADANHSYY